MGTRFDGGPTSWQADIITGAAGSNSYREFLLEFEDLQLAFLPRSKQTIGAQQSGFYAHSYGPFNEGVNDAAQALRLAGFLKGTEPSPPAGAPSFEEMIATAAERAGPRDQAPAEDFALSQRGHEAAERLRRSSRAYDQLFTRIHELRQDWDTPRLEDLVERVYETWPKYTERSVIKDEIAERRARRRS